MRYIAPLRIKSLTDAGGERTFSGYGSTFGNEDRVGDVVKAGAFSKSLEDHNSNGTFPSLLLHHDLKRPIGVWTKMYEDGEGLYVEGKLTQGVRDADEAYQLLKDGALHSMSIGYRVVDEEYDRKSGINYLNEVNLHEVSLVTIPANSQAVVSGVKSEDGQLNIRELERALREAGLSRKEAKTVLAVGFKAATTSEVAEKFVPKMDEKAGALAVTAQGLRASKIQNMLKDLQNVK